MEHGGEVLSTKAVSIPSAEKKMKCESQEEIVKGGRDTFAKLMVHACYISWRFYISVKEQQTQRVFLHF